ncbi:MAG: DNA-directed RNA polymerase subunit alpha [Chloroflexota bacterium]
MMNSQMVLPKHTVDRDAITANYGRFVVGPLEAGFGVVVGNALRRVLTASLPGAAVTSVRVSDVHHEFSVIPNVREDMTQLILQVKKLRLRLLSEEIDSSRLRLEHRGEGTVTAADIIVPPEVEIVNTELYLFTVDAPDSYLEMEFEVRPGRGFSPAEERGRLPIGELPVDAIYSPIRRVNFEVQKARGTDEGNFERLVLEIWTDGTMRPEEAMRQGAQILMRHLTVMAGADPMLQDGFAAQGEPEQEEEPRKSTHQAALYEKPIEELDLSVRVFNSLKRTGITTIGDVLDMLDRGPDAMLAIRNFGEKSLDELEEKLQGKGYLPGKDEEEAAVEETAE